MNAYNDVTLWVYMAIAVVGFYGFLLFGWWWGKNKFHSSAMYCYVMVLFLATAVSDAICVRARWLRHIDYDAYTVLLDSWVWHSRKILILVVLCCIASHMTWRALYGKKDDSDR